MSSTTGGAAQLRIFYDELERNLRSLEALDQDINSLSILTIIRSKLPHDVRRRLENHKPDADVWTVERLRTYLKRELKITEALSQSDKIFNGSNNNQTSNTPKNGGARPKSNYNLQSDQQKPQTLKGSGSTLVVTDPKPIRGKSCICCKGDHFAGDCNKFPTVEDRQNNLREQNRCFNCFSTAHQSSKQCNVKRACYYCKTIGTHHQSLCLKKFDFKSQIKPKFGGGSKGGKKGSSFFSQAEKDLQKDDDSSSDDSPQSPKVDGTNVSLSGTDGHSLLASDESFIMLTALVKVHNPKNGAVKETNSIFDCGSTHTYVTYAFAKELNLPLGKKLMLPITTFGTDNIQKFNDTVQVKDARYEVSFPWKVEEPNLLSNYTLAYNRFRSVAKRLAENPDLLKKYDDIIQNQVELRIIEPVNSNTTEGPLKHYVPHHPVEKDTSTYTKVRVVHDASAKSKKDNLSLNECLYPGPSLVKPLCGLLIRIRLHSIGIIADIEKAFLNIGLSTDDRDVTRFFWFKDPTNPTLSGNIQIYRFARVPFGVTSNPFLLASAVNHLLDSYGTTISNQLRDNIYVDNVITGAPNVESAIQIYNESQTIFKSASLNLRERSSNSDDFLQQLPEHHRASGSIFKVLGISWDTKADCFTITGFDKEKFQFISTKREVLQAIASVYDPLGFFTPVILIAKLFLHSLWSEKFNWDDKLPPDKLAQWTTIYARLQAISSFSIPRFLGHPMQPGAVHQLICFCDASADSYATTLYLRTSFNGVHRVDLIFSKTRLSPPNLSIPRLELMAALIGGRSMNSIEPELWLTNVAKMLWSDSQCVLHWICNRQKKSMKYVNEGRYLSICQNHIKPS